MKRGPLVLVTSLAAVGLALLIWRTARTSKPPAPSAPIDSALAGGSTKGSQDPTAINIYAHNLKLHRGPNFRVYVRWLRGEITRAHPNVNASFDDPDSFFIDIKSGVIRANMGDISNFLKANGMPGSPLKNIAISGDGDQIKLTGILHKLLPVEIDGTVSPASNNELRVRVTKLSVLKVPIKGALSDMHLSVANLFHPDPDSGIQVSGNDIFLDTKKLLPPPRIRGRLSTVRVANPDLEEIYGNAEQEEARVEQWRNFLRLRDGTLEFGKLTMHPVDLVMIDVSSDPWFDLDLANYQEQLVNGYARLTPQAGLQVFMPDLSTIPPSKANQNISVEWLKNRNIPPPPAILTK